MSNDEQQMREMMEKINQLKATAPGDGYTTPATQIPQGLPNGEPGLFDNQGNDSDVAGTSVNNGNIQQANPAGVSNDNQQLCPDCGTIHPPVQQGQKCPNATIEKQTGLKIDDAEVNRFLVQWRNILLSYISKMGIEDWKKEFQEVTIHIHKHLDGKQKEEANVETNPTTGKPS